MAPLEDLKSDKRNKAGYPRSGRQHAGLMKKEKVVEHTKRTAGH